MAQAILRRDTLHPLLRISVYRQFATGSYDTAVRDAFLIVEEWLKTTSGIEGEVGIGLVRAAFNPTGGPQTLIDMKLPAAERERMVDLFVGGIATFKDPVSHKVLGNCGPASVFEVLKFASQLLSYCDELCPARLCARTRRHD